MLYSTRALTSVEGDWLEGCGKQWVLFFSPALHLSLDVSLMSLKTMFHSIDRQNKAAFRALVWGSTRFYWAIALYFLPLQGLSCENKACEEEMENTPGAEAMQRLPKTCRSLTSWVPRASLRNGTFQSGGNYYETLPQHAVPCADITNWSSFIFRKLIMYSMLGNLW